MPARLGSLSLRRGLSEDVADLAATAVAVTGVEMLERELTRLRAEADGAIRVTRWAKLVAKGIGYTVLVVSGAGRWIAVIAAGIGCAAGIGIAAFVVSRGVIWPAVEPDWRMDLIHDTSRFWRYWARSSCSCSLRPTSKATRSSGTAARGQRSASCSPPCWSSSEQSCRITRRRCRAAPRSRGGAALLVGSVTVLRPPRHAEPKSAVAGPVSRRLTGVIRDANYDSGWNKFETGWNKFETSSFCPLLQCSVSTVKRLGHNASSRPVPVSGWNNQAPYIRGVAFQGSCGDGPGGQAPRDAHASTRGDDL